MAINHRGPFNSERDLAEWENKVRKYFKEQENKQPMILDDGKNRKLTDDYDGIQNKKNK